MQRTKRKATEPKKIPVLEKKEKPVEKQDVPVAKMSAVGSSPGNPATSLMVMKAIETLDDKNGVSLPAIKKFILENNDVNMKRQAPLIRRALKKAVESGTLVQTKGRGANGSFMLATPSSSVSQKKKDARKKPTATKKTSAKTKKIAVTAKNEESEEEEMEEKDVEDETNDEPAVEESKIERRKAKPTATAKQAKK